MNNFNDFEKAFHILKMHPISDKKTIRKHALDLLRVHHPDKSELENAHEMTENIIWAKNFLDESSDEDLIDFLCHHTKEDMPESIVEEVLERAKKTVSNTIKLPVLIGIQLKALRMVNQPYANDFFVSRMLDAKVLLVGGINSGKTDFFDEGFDRGLSLNINFKMYHTSQTYYSIFDMPCQERFKQMTRAYYPSAAVVFFFEDDMGLLNDWIKRNQLQQQDFQLFTLSGDMNQFQLEPYDVTSDTLQIKELNHPRLRTYQVPREQLKAIVHEIFNQLDNILRPSSQVESDNTFTVHKLSPKGEKHVCSIS